jgi:predicted pyridoxine 5'-phosphate oxidase superfamily flavin-nucleotide-binding protein
MEAFHAGEQALQLKAGVREQLAAVGSQILRTWMPEQHRRFFEQLPFLVVGSVDAQGQPWASLLAGPPGFVASPDPRHLRIAASPPAGSPLAAALVGGAPLGLLGIEPHTRRRNRMNGRVVAQDETGFTVEVGQSFGNCPKYIQAREARFTPERSPGAVVAGESLDARDRALIEAADTVFIASAHPRARHSAAREEGVDVSHRGGRPGFVRVDADGTLTLPDFSGNRFFNTLGNLALDPRAGLLIPDFPSGDLLQVAVETTLVTTSEDLARYEGALRLLRMRVLAVQRTPGGMPLEWGGATPSPFLAGTGRWQDSGG